MESLKRKFVFGKETTKDGYDSTLENCWSHRGNIGNNYPLFVLLKN